MSVPLDRTLLWHSTLGTHKHIHFLRSITDTRHETHVSLLSKCCVRQDGLPRAPSEAHVSTVSTVSTFSLCDRVLLTLPFSLLPVLVY